MRKKWLIVGIIAVLVIAGGVANSRSMRIAYHKWRLAAAIENTRTTGVGKPTSAQEFLALLGGKMSTAEECIEVWQRHEDALVDLNYLARREFDIGRHASIEQRWRVTEAAEKIFRGQPLWSVARSPSNEHAIMITARPAEMGKWERLIRRLREEKVT